MNRTVVTFATGFLTGAIICGGVTYSVLRNPYADNIVAPSNTTQAPSSINGLNATQNPWNSATTDTVVRSNTKDVDLDSLIAEWESTTSFAEKAALIEQIIQNCNSQKQWLRVRDLLLGTTAGPLRSDGIQRLVSHVAKRNPKAAIEDLLPSLNGIDKHNAMMEIAVEWSENNPLEALKYARNENAQETRGLITELASFNLAKSSPEQALQELGRMELLLSGEELGNAINGIIAGWSSHDPAGAYRFVKNELDLSADERTIVLETLVGNAALADAPSTIQFAETTLNGDEKEAAISTAYKIWSGNDTAAAATSAGKIAAGSLADAVVEEIVREWRNYDTDAANQWLEGLKNVSDEKKAALADAQPAEVDPDFEAFSEEFESSDE